MARTNTVKGRRHGQASGNGFRLVTSFLKSLGVPPKLTQGRRPRDFQRAKVYRWERAHVHTMLRPSPLPLAECSDLVREVFYWYEKPLVTLGWAPPQVTDGRGRRHACGSRDVIKLPRWARQRTIVLHECAHGMASDGHGPEFMARYIELLEEFASMDVTELVASARLAGVRVAK